MTTYEAAPATEPDLMSTTRTFEVDPPATPGGGGTPSPTTGQIWPL